MRLARTFQFAGFALAAAVMATCAGAQISTPAPAARQSAPLTRLVPLTDIPVPYDQAEPVSGGVQRITTPEDRAQTLQLLQNARLVSDIRLHPYDMKTSFTTYGSSSSDGRWILEDMSPSHTIYRWTAQGPRFSGVFITENRLLWSNQAGGAMPLRLAQVRMAMWGRYVPSIGPFASLRVATGNVNGGAVRCVLVARNVSRRAQPQFPHGRSFAESEYCIDPESGLLTSYSPYPGAYIRFDYANAFHFHRQIIPGGFTIIENGQTVIEARIDSVTAAPTNTSNLFDTSGLNALGVGQVIVPRLIDKGYQTALQLGPDSAPQVVALHGMIGPKGQLTEVEILATTNSALDDAAIKHASLSGAVRMPRHPQPGETPRSREAVFIIEFVPALPASSLNSTPAN